MALDPTVEEFFKAWKENMKSGRSADQIVNVRVRSLFMISEAILSLNEQVKSLESQLNTRKANQP